MTVMSVLKALAQYNGAKAQRDIASVAFQEAEQILDDARARLGCSVREYGDGALLLIDGALYTLSRDNYNNVSLSPAIIIEVPNATI